LKKGQGNRKNEEFLEPYGILVLRTVYEGDVLMMVAMGISAIKAGIQVIDTHHQMETNKKMRAVSELLGGEVYKRHRVFRKDL